jgi:hypothetical protein
VVAKTEKGWHWHLTGQEEELIGFKLRV